VEFRRRNLDSIKGLSISDACGYARKAGLVQPGPYGTGGTRCMPIASKHKARTTSECSGQKKAAAARDQCRDAQAEILDAQEDQTPRKGTGQ